MTGPSRHKVVRDEMPSPNLREVATTKTRCLGTGPGFIIFPLSCLFSGQIGNIDMMYNRYITNIHI